ncbi:MAG: phage baseplate assembly protein V [Candidatus Binataceae bacterium]
MWITEKPPIAPLRIAIVRALDPASARVRVVFPDHDQMQTYWLPILAPKTQNDKAYWMPDIGEQVVCLMDAHDEAGVVLGAIYSSADPPPVNSADKFHVSFADGAAIEYDRAAHSLTIELSSGGLASINAPGGITLKCGGSQVSIGPNGVSISPPLPLTSTAAQT